MNKIKKLLIKKFYIIFAIVHLLITFVTDKLIFTFPVNDGGKYYKIFQIDYTICKIITFVVLCVFYGVVTEIIIYKLRRSGKIKMAEGLTKFDAVEPLSLKLIKCAAPYAVVMLLVSVFKLRQGYLTNDETLIYDNAIKLIHYTWFTYITTYYYIVSLMILPFKYGPIMMKLILEFFSVGYIVFRIKNYFEVKKNNNISGDIMLSFDISFRWFEGLHLKEKMGLGRGRAVYSEPITVIIRYYYLSYFFFLLYPFIAYTTSAHRLPLYFLLYLVLVCTLVFDLMENKPLTSVKSFRILFLGAILTQWRTEGIYLLVFVPILVFFAYKNVKDIASMIAIVVISIIMQAMIYIPQNVIGVDELSAAANDRMKPFYAYTIVNMFRNGLEEVNVLKKNKEDIEIIDRYMSIDAINAINEYYKDINYEDTLILYEQGFIGVREEATIEDFFNYSEALKRIFKNNPGIFIKTRIGAFKYAAMPYHMSVDFSGVKGIAKTFFSIFKSLSYNLFIPLVIMFCLAVFSLIKKRWFTMFMSGAILAHWFIVFILAPASYFKYYFPLYAVAYFYVLLLILQTIYNRKSLKNITFLK